MGYGAALRTLIDTANAAGADILVTVDGDGQHNPQEISSMIAPILNGEADVVIGARFAHDGDGELPRFRKTGIKSITWLVDELTNQRISDAQSGFRAYGKRALSTIRPAEQGMGASTEILLKAKDKGLKVVEVPATITYKGGETSTLNPIYHFADVVSSTIKVASIRHPLLTYGVPGLVFLFLSLVFGARATQVLSTQGQFDIGVALISIGAAVIGTILAITALMLFVLVSVIREASK